MILAQVLLGLLVIVLEYGPIGRQGTSGIAPMLSVLGAWGFTWFGNRSQGLRWAVTVGLLMDLISFMPFGIWTVSLVSTSALTELLRTRFFEVSSLMLALLTLVITSIFAGLIVSAGARSFDLFTLATEVVSNVFVGIIIYYVVALPFRFLQRWTGRRL